MECSTVCFGYISVRGSLPTHNTNNDMVTSTDFTRIKISNMRVQFKPFALMFFFTEAHINCEIKQIK